MCREGQGLTSIIAAPPSHFIAGIDGGAPHQVKKVFLSFHPRSTVTASSTFSHNHITLKTGTKILKLGIP